MPKKNHKALSIHEQKDLLTQNRIIFFHESVDRYAVEQAVINIEYLNTLNSKPITLRICSPGGSVDHGLALYDLMKSSKAPIHTICFGFAASMGAILLAAGKKGHRAATKNSRIMIHQPSSGFNGKASEMANYTDELKRIHRLLSVLISQDTGKPFNKVLKDMNEDYWMSAEQAREYGLIDKVV